MVRIDGRGGSDEPSRGSVHAALPPGYDPGPWRFQASRAARASWLGSPRACRRFRNRSKTAAQHRRAARRRKRGRTATEDPLRGSVQIAAGVVGLNVDGMVNGRSLCFRKSFALCSSRLTVDRPTLCNVASSSSERPAKCSARHGRLPCVESLRAHAMLRQGQVSTSSGLRAANPDTERRAAFDRGRFCAARFSLLPGASRIVGCHTWEVGPVLPRLFLDRDQLRHAPVHQRSRLQCVIRRSRRSCAAAMRLGSGAAARADGGTVPVQFQNAGQRRGAADRLYLSLSTWRPLALQH
jgi:hypothetical protein